MFNKLTGDAASGVLLQHMVRWYEASKFTKDGKQWHARTRDEIQERLGMSEWSVRKAMDTIKDQGLMEFSTGPHPTKRGILRATYFAPTAKLMALLDAKKGTPILTTNSEDVLQTVSEDALTTNSEDALQIHKTNKYITKESNKKLSATTFQEVAESGYKTKEVPKVIAKAKDVEDLFAALCAKYMQAYFHVAWTRKELGMANNLIRKAKASGLDLRFILTNSIPVWSDVVRYADYEGVFPLPIRPKVGWVLQHFDLVATYANMPAGEDAEPVKYKTSLADFK